MTAAGVVLVVHPSAPVTNFREFMEWTKNYKGALNFGSAGNGNGQFNAPVGIAFDSSGNIYVTDVSNNRVQKFTANGVYVSQFGSAGSGNGQFNAPFGIAIH